MIILCSFPVCINSKKFFSLFFLLSKVIVTVGSDTHTLEPPFCLLIRNKDKKTELQLKIKIIFHANYGEPPLTRDVIIKRGVGKYRWCSILLTIVPFILCYVWFTRFQRVPPDCIQSNDSGVGGNHG